jgi:hypothetical protein
VPPHSIASCASLKSLVRMLGRGHYLFFFTMFNVVVQLFALFIHKQPLRKDLGRVDSYSKVGEGTMYWDGGSGGGPGSRRVA